MDLVLAFGECGGEREVMGFEGGEENFREGVWKLKRNKRKKN